MLDSHVFLTCSQCNAKMKYRGSRQHLLCKRCGASIAVPQSSTQSNPANSSPTTQTFSTILPVPIETPVSEPIDPSSTLIADLLLGILIGLIAFVLISYFKVDITKLGLVLIICGTVLALAVQYYVSQARARHGQTTGTLQRILGLPLLLVLIVTGFLTVLEVFIPHRDGICRRIIEGERPPTDEEIQMAGSRQEQQRLQARLEADNKKQELLAKETVERQNQWNQADCLLINPGHKVVGLRVKNARTQPEFILVAKTDETVQGKLSPESIMKDSWDRRVPIIAHNPELARRVFADVEEARPLANEYHDQLRRAWAPVRFIPERRAVYYLEASGERKRFGFNYGSNDKGFVFCDLVPKRQFGIYTSSGEGIDTYDGFSTDQIERDRHMKSGTQPQELLDHELRQQADLLDYFIMDMLRKLQNHQNQANSLYEMRAPSIYVDDVEYDPTYADLSLTDLRTEMAKFRGELKQELESTIKQYDVSGKGLSALVDSLLRISINKQKEVERKELREIQRQQIEEDLQALRRQIKKLETCLELKKSLTSEIRTRLIRTRMTLVERSPKFLELASRETLRRQKNESSGNVTSGIPFSDALQAGMLDASHILLTAIRRPKEQGSYEVSMRLVDVRTGVILWEEQDDRRDSSLATSTGTSSGKPKLLGLSGRWRDPVLNNEFEITDDGKDILMKLTRSRHVSDFALRARYSGSDIKVDNCFLVFNVGSGKRHTIDASIKVLSEKKCEVNHETVTSNGQSVFKGPRETFFIERIDEKKE